MNRKLLIPVAVLLMVLASGCHRRPLYDPEDLVMVKVVVDVKAITNVTEDIYNDKIAVPSTETDMLRVMVYDPETKNLLTQSFVPFSNTNAYDEYGNRIFEGNLAISYGDYDFVIYNFDTPTTQIKNEPNENQILAYTPEISESGKTKYLGSRAGDYSNIAINEEPDHLMVAREHDIRVSPHDDIVVIETTAETIVDTYYIQIHVEGMQYATSGTAVITGLSPANYFGLNDRVEDPTAAVCFPLQFSTDERLPGENKDVLCAVFNTFGKVNDATSDLHVTFNVTDTAGNLQQRDINLDAVFKTEEAIEHHWLLIQETWEIINPQPGPTPSSGGFQPTVDDWEEEHGSIVL